MRKVSPTPRYLAILFFDACLSLRLPDRDAGNHKLKLINMKAAWFAVLLSDKAESAYAFTAALARDWGAAKVDTG